MTDSHELLQVVSHYAADHPGSGVLQTVLPGVSIVRAVTPAGLEHAISRPLACLVLQGGKRVMMGKQSFDFAAGDSLLITSHVPTVSQITHATTGAPYYSIVFELDSAVILDLAAEIDFGPARIYSPLQIEPTSREVADVALRLVRLLDRRGSLAVLHAAYLRELQYWLLVGKHGASIRQIGMFGGHQGIARAISTLREQFSGSLSIEGLAALAGMSVSSFHEHFRAVTALTPLQFQKQLRLIEAKRLMLSDDMNASSAAFEVGYESVQQFNREYGRMFGAPPMRDVENAKSTLAAFGQSLFCRCSPQR